MKNLLLIYEKMMVIAAKTFLNLIKFQIIDKKFKIFKSMDLIAMLIELLNLSN